jgi:hypothetical protein
MALRADAQRHQHVSAGWDLRPALAKWGAAGRHEGPVEELRRPGAAVERGALQGDRNILKIDGARQQRRAGLGVLLEAPVVVAGHEELVAVGQLAQPGVQVD